MSEEEKSETLREQEEHLRVVKLERSYYNSLVTDFKDVVTANTLDLGNNGENSRPISAHYSFDFAQQIFYPNDPLQPGPIYFLVPRKCAIFGVCCEGIPKQVNFLIDEGSSVSKGSNSVISYLDYFFTHYGLGEEDVHLHADNCSGQNKNRFMLWYLCWRTLYRRHSTIAIHFLITGHTKFAPDWCFGLLKQNTAKHPFPVSPISSLLFATVPSLERMYRSLLVQRMVHRSYQPGIGRRFWRLTSAPCLESSHSSISGLTPILPG